MNGQEQGQAGAPATALPIGHVVVMSLPDGRQFEGASIDEIVAWARDGRVPADAVITEQGRAPIVASRHPALAAIATGNAGESEAVAAIIPYRNAPALIGYYISVGSLIPFVGLLAGPVAIALGIVGFRKVRREPRVRGTAHAVVAIVLGGLTSLLNWGVVVLMIVSIIAASASI